MDKKHNGIISFWKFAFSLLIVALHLGKRHTEVLYHFESGSIAVEFFFIVSGYLFCHKCLNTNIKENIGKDTVKYILNKINKYIPYVVFLWIISLPIMIFVEKYDVNKFILSFYNILYIPVKNNFVSDIYGITWYIVAMLIVEWILYPIIVKYKKIFIYWISPLIVYFGYNYLLIKFGHLAVPWKPSIICFGGLIRAMVGINLGMIAYLISNKIKQIQFNSFSCFLMTIMEIFGYMSIFVIVNAKHAHVRFDVLMVIILFICIVISFSTKSLLFSISNNKLFYSLEKISLPIYLNHWLVIYTFEHYINFFNIKMGYYYELFIVILITMIVSFISIFVVSFWKNKNINIKNLFIIH